MAELQEGLKGLQQQSAAAAAAAAAVTVSNVHSQLEKVKLPKFGGDQRDWQGFCDKFTAMVINDKALMPVIKFQHLLNSVSGEPAELLRGIKVESDNFHTAWEARVKLLRLNTHLKTIIQLPTASTESVAHLNQLLSTTNESLNVFKALAPSVANCDSLLVYCVSSKLAPSMQLDWAKDCEAKDVTFAKYEDLRLFVETRIRTLDRLDASSKDSGIDQAKGSRGKGTGRQATNSHLTVNQKNSVSKNGNTKCIFCAEPHSSSSCKEFLAKTTTERRAIARTKKLCFNCLGTSHMVSECSSKYRCRACQGKHHTKLHIDQGEASGKQSELANNESFGTAESSDAHLKTVTSTLASLTHRHKILTTAIVTLISDKGLTFQARALLDPCSEESYVSENVAKALELDTHKTLIAVNGLGNSTSVARGWVNLTVKSPSDADFEFQVEALTMSRLTSKLPSAPIDIQPWTHMHNLDFADPFYATRSSVDCLLGVDVVAAALRPGLITGPAGTPTALNTVFGWVLMGKGQQRGNDVTQAFSLTVNHELSAALQAFWEVEEISAPKLISPEDTQCYEHFKENVQRDHTGRFIVRLPLVKTPALRNSKNHALGALRRMKRRLENNAELREAYNKFMAEYNQLQHMSLLPDRTKEDETTVYIPHHPVVRDESLKKIRIVFNASSKDAKGQTLNDFMHSGPNLLEDTRVLLLRWRLSRYAFSCDIVKMFRQFLVHPDDRKWQRILWRDSPDKPVQHYSLNTVTYGTVSAPFLANACMLEFATQEAEPFPLGAKILQYNRYADDFFVGDDSESNLITKAGELVKILKSAAIDVGKWASNSRAVIEQYSSVSSEPVELKAPTTLPVSVLGILWTPSSDALHYHVPAVSTAEATKRGILSAVAKLYDPLGFLSPVIIRAKILLQDLWLLGIDWDAKPSEATTQAWREFQEDIVEAQLIKIPRWLSFISTNRWDLHGFCDASQKAYAAAVYAVVYDTADNPIDCHLLIAKTKVAPMKVLNIPRLELQAALLLARLVNFVNTSLQQTPSLTYCWTDSNIVLAWLRSHPSR
ncbi:unnamed protein product [Trichogramma brassicae]|nr:unnamed protein product [Trichogramma brassicae]